jgi:hypothetical protein
MDMGFAISGQLAQHRMPQIQFLSIGSYVCSTLLSDPASRRRPCASLSLHLHQVVKRTFTFELSNMLGTPKKGPDESGPVEQLGFVLVRTPRLLLFLRSSFFLRDGLLGCVLHLIDSP